MTDRDDIIEELYSLEQSWRGGLPSRSVNWSAADEATNACADELADLIKELTEDAHLVQNDGRGAELGQEVGAVAPVSFAVELADGTLGALGWVDYAKFEHVKNMGTLANGARYVFAYRTSTSHTSEARDAVVAELIAAAENHMNAEPMSWQSADAFKRLTKAIAAMRQEGGNG